MFPKEWRGSNILGWALMQVRSTLNSSTINAIDEAGGAEGGERADNCYEQLSNTGVRHYCLPHPAVLESIGWQNVSRVAHECKITGDVVFDEEVTDQNLDDFKELWRRPCHHPGGLRSLFSLQRKADSLKKIA